MVCYKKCSSIHLHFTVLFFTLLALNQPELKPFCIHMKTEGRCGSVLKLDDTYFSILKLKDLMDYMTVCRSM